MERERFTPGSPVSLWLSTNQERSAFGDREFSFIVRKEMTSSNGVVQSGIYMLFAYEVYEQLQAPNSVPAEVKLEVFQAVGLGETVRARSVVTDQGTAISFYTIEGRLCARVIPLE